jgi:hypothetical protein
MAGREGLLWSMERHAQKGGGRHLVELLVRERESFIDMHTPCVEFADETPPCIGEPSCAFDFAESLLPRPVTRFNRSLKDESSLMAFANTFDEERTCLQWGEYCAEIDTRYSEQLSRG